MNDSFVKYLSSMNSDAARASLALYEQVCSDVNPPLVSPGQPCCTQSLDENEYFDEPTLSDEELDKVHQAKTGFRRVLAPSAGRTTLGIMGNGFPENVCASSGSST
jgi:hypothetical protein